MTIYCPSSFLTLFTALLLLVGLGCDSPDAGSETEAGSVDASICSQGNGGITLPDGFCAAVVVDSLNGNVRHMTVRDNGDIYVALRQATGAGGITALRDTDGDGRADSVQTFGSIAGTGIDILDGYLYISTDTSVHRMALSDGDLVPSGTPELIAGGFLNQGSHAAKSFAFDESGQLFVNVGGPSNACQEQQRSPGSPGLDPCPQLERQGGIWRFSADTPDQTQEADGHRFATGIRNAMAIAWHPSADAMFVVQHGRDQLSTLWSDLYTDEESAELPAEEMLRLSDGADFGWPYCYYDQIKRQKVLAPEYGGDGEEVGRCADVPAPTAAFPGHYAPNDLAFYTGNHFPARYEHGAFIAFHGSWNRAPLPQQGYQVAFVPMNASGNATGEWETFADGFKGVAELESPGNAVHRPMGLSVGPDGTLYVADSQQGRIWRIIHRGETAP